VLVIVGASAGKAVAVTVLPAWEAVPAVIAPEQWTVAAALARLAAAVLSKALAAVAAPHPAPARVAARVGEVSVVVAAPEEEVVVVDAAEAAAGGVGKHRRFRENANTGYMVPVSIVRN
jgi:hypothetical protein